MTSPSYPAALDALANPGPTTETDDAGYELDIVIARLQNCVMAIENKLGIGTDIAVAKLHSGAGGEILRGGAFAAWGQLQAADVTPGLVGRPISETTISGTAAAITIPVPSSPWKSLQLVAATIGTTAATNVVAQFSADGTTYDTTANYDWQWMSVAGGAASLAGGEAYAQTSALIGNTTAAAFAIIVADFPAASAPVVNRQFQSRFFRKVDVVPGSLTLGQVGGLWRSFAPIRGIKLVPSAGSFGNGTYVALYGLPA